jgi:hypothetical protein
VRIYLIKCHNIPSPSTIIKIIANAKRDGRVGKSAHCLPASATPSATKIFNIKYICI